MELNDVNVHKVLDEIRPYIEADGGILEFISIDYLKEGPVVLVKLLGACAGCAMSAQTMSMGIEKLVKDRFPEVQKVISGDRNRVRQLKLEPGDLQIFKGRFTLHRVTKIEGQKSRYMCIPAYVLDPWRVNTPEHSKAIYGKVLPIHIERNQARSDGLTD